MTEKQAVIVCGKSLFMSGVALDIEDDVHFRVIKTVDPAEISYLLQSIQPVAIIVDDAGADPDWLAVINRERPSLPIIALNPENSAALICFWRREQVKTAQDLKDIILEQLSR